MNNSEIGAIFFFIILIGLVVFLVWFFVFKIKHLKVPDVYLVTGGVKTGKSFVSVYLAVRQYKRNCRKVAVQNFFIRFLVNPIRFIFRKEPFKKKEKPMLYSNMKLRHIKYNLLTLDIIKRKVRIPTKSVVLIDEVSLMADSMLGRVGKDSKDDIINEQLMLFVKLFGHYCGGTMIVNTQSLCDCHYAFRRCISNYLWIEVKRKYPFFSLMQVRELAHSEDNDIVNNFQADAEVDTRPLFVWNKYYRYYDYRCYSIFTDNLELQVNYDNPVLSRSDSLKTEVLLTLQDFKSLKEFSEEYLKLKEKQAQPKEVKDNEKA